MNLEKGKIFINNLLQREKELGHSDVEHTNFSEAPLEYVYEGVKYVKNQTTDTGTIEYVNRQLMTCIRVEFANKKNLFGKLAPYCTAVHGPYPYYQGVKKVKKLKEFSKKKRNPYDVFKNFK